ncbi:hypothetical protein V3G39_11095 [Dermatophilaceae bacterium Sec6.4]|nr:hypothetical protein [Actinomycetota bacterium]
MTRGALLWAGIALLGIGLVMIVAASRNTRTESQKKGLRATAVGVDVAAAILFIVASLR